MSGEADIHELAPQIAVLEERMNTKQAEYKTDIGQLRAELASRDTGLVLVVVGTIIAAAGLATAVLDILITT